MPELRIVLVDDHPVYSEGLAALLATLPEFEVVGTASNGAEALEVVAATAPDVVVMDVQMPVMDGLEATRRLAVQAPGVGVVVLTMSEDDDTVFEAMRAGARGYLLKGADQEDISRCIRSVAQGDAVFGAGVASRMAEYFSRLGATRPAGRESRAFPQLTDREREILDLIAAGRSNKQIAEQLFLAHKTVRNNVSTIFAKLQVAGRTEAVIAAREAGLGS